MSGSGSSGYVPPQNVKFDCETGIIITRVSSVDFSLLSIINVGDIFEVELSETESLILVSNNGEILGAIVHLNNEELINCIKKGNRYKAKITSKTSHSCQVKIERI